MSLRWATSLLAAIALSHWPLPARADIDLVSSETVHGVVDLRLSGASGEPSFTEGGFGKDQYGGGGGAGLKGRLQLAEGALEWTPRLNWDWSAVVDAGYQPGQEHPVDLYQAYIVNKPVPRSATHVSVRAGLFYPPVSLEHDARVWGVTNTITPSAINSWVGEELKVVGLEATVSRDFGGQQLAATVAVFGFDDTAGTLLSFRGWAFHDLKSQAFGNFDLPPLSGFEQHFQAQSTYPTLEVDHRAGYYAQLQWRPSDRVTLQALYYDNRGDAVGVTSDLQWAWATSFASGGASLQLDEHTRVLLQALSGRTIIGRPVFRLTDVAYRSAYALISRDLGKGVVSLRGDAFETIDMANRPPVSNGERGWSLTAAWRYPLTDLLDLRLEAQHIESTRPSRVLAGEGERQVQDVLQSSLRLTF